MNKARGPIITISGNRLKLDLLWIGLACALSIPAGWFLATHLIPDASHAWRITHSAIAPFVFLAGLGIQLLVGVRGHSGTVCDSTLWRILPFGRVNLAYHLPGSSEVEFRREFVSCFIMLGLCGLMLSTYLVPDSHATSNAIRVPGMLLAVMFGIQIFPTLPFHGGYLFRSIFWYLHDDARAGTRAALVYSQLFVSAGIGFGAFFLMTNAGMLIPGIWSIVLGVLILTAFRFEIRRVSFVQRASDVRAADAVSGLNPTVRASASLTEAIDILLEQKDNGPGLVRDRNVYAGAIDLGSVRNIPRDQWQALTVEDAIIPFDDLVDSAPGSDLLSVLRKLDSDSDAIVIIREESSNIVGLIDKSMDPGMLIRRGITRDPTGASGGSRTREDPDTS